MFLQQFFVEGLGCASYLVGCESKGVAAVVDPDREVQKYLDAAATRGVRITHIIETHLHADHVSGNTDLAQRTGASIYVHSAAQAEFAHKALNDGDEIQLGGALLKVLHTPGHTPEGITLLAADTTRSPQPWLALTGDTLFVGDIGRPDLVGADAARSLAQDMYASLFDNLLKLDDSLLLYPGHGAGSLCGKSIGSMRSSTLGYERKFNPALAEREKDSFVEYATANLPEQPANHTRIKSLNRKGPQPLGQVQPKALDIQQAIPHFQRGAAMLDVRSKADFVARHVPGAVNIEADAQLANKVGFVLPANIPVVLVVDNEQQYLDTIYALARVGYEQVVGYLQGGLDAWEAMGLPVTSGDIEDISVQQLDGLLQAGPAERPRILDVREAWEYQQGHIPGAHLIPLGELQRRTGELDPETPVAVICASGSRSQSGAMLLGQQNFKKVYNVVGGMNSWMMAGLPMEQGERVA